MGESAVFWPVSSLRRLFRFGAGRRASGLVRADAAQTPDAVVRSANKVNRAIGVIGSSLEAVIAALRLARAGGDVFLFEGERPLSHGARNPHLMTNATPFASRILARATPCDPLDDAGRAVLRKPWVDVAVALEGMMGEAGIVIVRGSQVQVQRDGRSFLIGVGSSAPIGARAIIACEPFAFLPPAPKNHVGAIRPLTLDPRASARAGRALLIGKVGGGPPDLFRRIGASGRTLEVVRSDSEGGIAVIVSPIEVRARNGGWSLADRDGLAIDAAKILAEAGYADAAFAQVLPPMQWDGGLAGARELAPLAIDGPRGIITLNPEACTGAAAGKAARMAAEILSLKLEADDEPIRL